MKLIKRIVNKNIFLQDSQTTREQEKLNEVNRKQEE